MNIIDRLPLNNKEELKRELSSPLVQWAGLAILLIVVIMFLVLPYMQWRDQFIDTITVDSAQLIKLESLNAKRESVNTIREKVDAIHQKAQSHLLQARTYNGAISEQLTALESIFNPLNITFETRRFGDGAYKSWLGERIHTEWTFVGSSQSLMDFLYRIADEDIIIIPDDIEMVPYQVRGEAKYKLSGKFISYRKLAVDQIKQQERLK
ncbi:hypothetical protein Q9290_16360 [Oceanimonas sp. CHS3-5]|uniref:hypothetical protein n=1 Tax=Oceanimonas sp. CHS3-5 TaxID=3068186 RepID=UPI00273FA4CD|nr:hypothetical protein [Oceanimonas sp. CHS3-5]MDP5293844.1 hypothetical protein [Oceanimonas sp. CHS3-5]